MRRTTMIAVTAAVALVVSGCTSAASDDPTPDATMTADAGFPLATAQPAPPAGEGTADPVPAQFVGLSAASSCDALLDHYVDNAVELVTPWGLGNGGGVIMMEGEVLETAEAGGDDSAMPMDAAAEASAPGGGGDEFSTTNVQEQGVDEPDTVKTDGARLVTITEGRVDVVDVASAEVVGTLRLDEEYWAGELLMAGDDLLVMATTGQGWGGPMPADNLVPAFPVQRTIITRVDLADPSDPQVVGSATLEGAYRSARMVDGTVRLVIESDPTGLVLTTPTDSGLSAEQEALEENQRLLRESDLDDWMPHYRVTGPDGLDGDVTPLLPCDQVALPAEFSGFQTLSVVTLEIGDDEMNPTSVAGIVASGETVYASSDRLIVGTSPWGQWFIPFAAEEDSDGRDDITTQLHSFDITDPTATTYVGSGEVAGTMVNQFALSERDGVVRVATTTNPGWWGDGDEESQSSLVVLAEQDGELVETGRVDGLGVTEQIHSVRYLSDDLAAIVTFRQTDPLYLVDTSDPTSPTVAGELKIPGVSTYLHPIGDGWLLGVGQDATDEGRTTGLQLSLFDVSDPSDPRRVDNLTWKGGYSPAEYDHHAFLHWPATGQVVLPIEIHDEFIEEFEGEEPGDEDIAPRESKPFSGAVVVEVEPGRLAEQGMVTQDGSDGVGWDVDRSIQRSLVIGDDLWTLGWNSLTRHDLATLDHETELSLS